jgi:hypothetical protein
MNAIFSKQSVYLYTDRFKNYNFVGVEVWSMVFDNPNNPNLDYCHECEAQETPDFYSVFVIFPDKGEMTLTQPTGRDCVADCVTGEMANQIEQLLLMAGNNFVRQ